MKLKLSFFLIMAILFGLISCKYSNYEETYNKDGLIILRLKKEKGSGGQHEPVTPKKKMGLNKAVMPFKTGDDVDPNSGVQVDDYTVAVTLINAFQGPLNTAKDSSTTRYVDFYFNNLRAYIDTLTKYHSTDELNNFGLRFYFSRIMQGRKFSNGIVVGPIKVLDPTPNKQIIDPLWITDPGNYKAFDFGSLCPDNCSNSNDYSGMKPH